MYCPLARSAVDTTVTSCVIEPESGNGFDERGRVKVRLRTESRTASLMRRVSVASVKVVVSLPRVTPEWMREVSVVVPVVKTRVVVSFELR